MPILDALENRVINYLYNRLSTVGVPSSDYLTVPSVTLGVPSSAIESVTTPQIYIQYVSTIPNEAESTTLREHPVTIRAIIWCIANDIDTMLKVKADVIRRLFACEGDFISQFQQPFYPSDFVYRDDAMKVGGAAGALTVKIDVNMSHDNP